MPDASIFIMVIYSSLFNEKGTDLWNKPNGLYWQDPWQTYSAISNSFPLWGLVLLIGIILFYYSKSFKSIGLKSIGLGILIFGIGYFLHIVIDFFTHADDAHKQFWPFSDWRFYSPVSYYQPQYYGRIVSVFETIMGLAIVVYLFVRFKKWATRILAILLALPYFISMLLHF